MVNGLHTHECRIWEQGRAVYFWEYTNRIFGTVQQLINARPMYSNVKHSRAQNHHNALYRKTKDSVVIALIKKKKKFSSYIRKFRWDRLQSYTVLYMRNVLYMSI
jgi:hypothetical protein